MCGPFSFFFSFFFFFGYSSKPQDFRYPALKIRLISFKTSQKRGTLEKNTSVMNSTVLVGEISGELFSFTIKCKRSVTKPEMPSEE